MSLSDGNQFSFNVLNSSLNSNVLFEKKNKVIEVEYKRLCHAIVLIAPKSF